MQRLALVSHLSRLLELNIDDVSKSNTTAPERYSYAVEFLSGAKQTLVDEDNMCPEIKELRAAFGVSHIEALTLLRPDLGEMLTSIAASWAVLRSPNYESNVGKIQRWMSRAGDQDEVMPYGNE